MELWRDNNAVGRLNSDHGRQHAVVTRVLEVFNPFFRNYSSLTSNEALAHVVAIDVDGVRRD